MEYKLVNIERVRTIYEKYITVFPDNPDPFIQWAEMEKSLNEIDRYRALFELAISHPTMSMPEKVWKSYIDNEIELEEYENVRRLFEELLSRSKNVKIWLSYASFEAKIDQKDKFRSVLQRAEDFFKGERNMKEERAIVLESWKKQEEKFGDSAAIASINARQPNKVKRKRKIVAAEEQAQDEGEEAGEEEYYDYIFPGEEDGQNLTKILQKAKQKALEKKLQ